MSQNLLLEQEVKKNRVKDFMQHPFVMFLAKKLFFYIIVLYVALTLIFLLPRLLPGDPAARILPAKRDTESVEDYEARAALFKEFYGLNDSLWQQYMDFWSNLFRGDLGPSYTDPGKDVIEILVPAAIFTFSIVIPVIVISFFLGNWIGANSAYNSKSRSGKFAYYFAMLAQSTPFYWMAIIFYWFFVFKTGIFNFGYADAGVEPSFTFAFINNIANYYVLPFLTLLIGYTGGWATGMRSMTLNELQSGYLQYAKQLGFRDISIKDYAQRNAILPQITGLNLRLGDAIGATLVLEWVFGWPGVGDHLLSAAESGNYPLLMGASMIIIFIVVVGNFFIDILYGFIDPRIKTGVRS